MATAAEDALQELLEGRAEAGLEGFRPHAVSLVKGLSETGQPQDTVEHEELAIVEANSQPPKVVQLNDEQVAVGGLARGTIEIGPITPAFAGGGTDLGELVGRKLEGGDTLHVKITGPLHPTGALYRIVDVRAYRALRYMLRAKPVDPLFPE